MFKRLDDVDEPSVSITVENRQITVPASDSVAAAMLAADMMTARTTPVSGAHRGPYCMMGTCFECLVEIDGVPNQQACQTQVREGMIITFQKGLRDIES
jgi:predicted molibdopterin-dependent oxidoreductase YjgC